MCGSFSMGGGGSAAFVSADADVFAEYGDTEREPAVEVLLTYIASLVPASSTPTHPRGSHSGRLAAAIMAETIPFVCSNDGYVSGTSDSKEAE